jgi:hypothetical protein
VADASSAVVTLISVVVGGALTMAGGWLVEWRKQAAEKKRQRVQKFEELVDTVYGFERWLEAQRNALVFGADVNPGPSPFAKMLAISAAYFPQFTDRVFEMETASFGYTVWMSKMAQKRLAGTLTNVDGFDEVIAPFTKKQGDLLRALTEFARQEFQ